MSLRCEFEDWVKFPTSLGSEAKIATIVGRVYTKVGKDIPEPIVGALRCLGRRADNRDRRRIMEEALALAVMAAGNFADENGIQIDKMLNKLFIDDDAGNWAPSITIICSDLEEKLRAIEGEI